MTRLKIGLIADDFTGAMDSGAQFVGACLAGSEQPVQVSFRFSGEAEAGVEIINTASREIPLNDARLLNQAAAQNLPGRLLFKKIDSTMRGHIAAEVEAILQVSSYRKALICPSAPLQGRTLIGGSLKVNGIPLDQTAFKDDPVYPARTASVAALLGQKCAHLPLELVRSGTQALARKIDSLNDTALVTCDAETAEDLDLVARAIIQTGALPCGSFGLARAFVSALGAQFPSEKTTFQPAYPVLVVVGSAHQVARRQVAALAAAPGVSQFLLEAVPQENTADSILASLKQTPQARVIVLAARQAQTLHVPEWLVFGQTISRLAADLLAKQLPIRTIAVVGGETVTTLCQLLDVESIELLGEAQAGVPFGRLRGGRLDGCTLVTKAGGFGDDNTLSNIFS